MTFTTQISNCLVNISDQCLHRVMTGSGQSGDDADRIWTNSLVVLEGHDHGAAAMPVRDGSNAPGRVIV